VTAVFLLLRKGLALIPWWAWPVAALAGFAAWEHHRANGLQQQVDTAAAEHRARLAMAEEVGRMLMASAARNKGIRDAAETRTRSRLESQLRELRDRPVDRLPPAAAAACVGTSGAELSRPDAEFLAGEAARAERLIARLDECRAWVDDAQAARPMTSLPP
jgi:hypothetical protein